MKLEVVYLALQGLVAQLGANRAAVILGEPVKRIRRWVAHRESFTAGWANRIVGRLLDPLP